MRRTFAAWCIALAGFTMAAAAMAQSAPEAAPAETLGQIDGKPARYVASGDNVLLTTAEAARLGIDYRQGKSLSVGDVTLWVVTLGSVTIDGKVHLFAPAGVVASVPEYIAALRAHAVETFAKSHRVEVQVGGKPAQAFDLGEVLLMSVDEAERIGLAYRDGKRENIGTVPAWRVDATITRAGRTSPQSVVVAEPDAFLQALEARNANRAR